MVTTELPTSLTTGIPSGKAFSAGSVRSNPSGLTSPPSGSVTHTLTTTHTLFADLNIIIYPNIYCRSLCFIFSTPCLRVFMS